MIPQQPGSGGDFKEDPYNGISIPGNSQGIGDDLDIPTIIRAVNNGQRGIAQLYFYEFAGLFTCINGQWERRYTTKDTWSKVYNGEEIEALSLLFEDGYLGHALLTIQTLKKTIFPRNLDILEADEQKILSAIQKLNNLNYCKDVVEFAGIMIGGGDFDQQL